MAHRVELAFRRAAARILPEGSHVLAAVSGGGDSVALLRLLERFAASWGLQITVAHLDHGLRRGSRTDRRFVERLAADLSLPCLSDRRPVGPLRRKDESPQEAARRVRRQFLLAAASEMKADCIATGHTLDDQAETILMRLVRGAGATALTGMAPAGAGLFIRPLLGLERGELRDYLRSCRQPFREDPSNENMRYDRTRLRRLVLPVLAEALNSQAARHLVQAAALLREDAQYLDALAQAALPGILRRAPAGEVILDATGLARQPAPLAKRLARLALERAGVDARHVSARHVEALLDLARGEEGRRLHLPGRMQARRHKGRLVLSRAKLAPP